MEYVFEIPREYSKIIGYGTKKKHVKFFHRGGYCSTPNRIYLFGFPKEFTSERDSEIYQYVLTHEHIHAILYGFGIPIEQQELMIRKVMDPN